MRAEIITCAGCGEPLELQEGIKIVHCKYCGNSNVIPKFFSKETEQAFNNAEQALLEGEFDRALRLFENIEKDYPTDAHLHWSMALSRYGIRLEKDTDNSSYIPTMNRMQKSAFLNDCDYKMAVEYEEDEEVRDYYIDMGEHISKIQREYNELSSSISPFDIFICYKETDERGIRSKDSILAENLYNRMTEEGYKVFYSRVTMNGYIGKQYEPVIYSALHTACVFIVVGTSEEYINSSWVKNEWSRFLNRMKTENHLLLVLAYSGIKPEDFPDALSSYQGFEITSNEEIESLVKRITRSLNKQIDPLTISNTASESKNLVLRVQDELQRNNFREASRYVEEALNKDFTNAEAHLLKLLIEFKVHEIDEIEEKKRNLENYPAYENYLKYSQDSKRKQQLKEINNRIKACIDKELQERREQEELEETELLASKKTFEEARQYYQKIHSYRNLSKCKKLVEQVLNLPGAGELIHNCDEKMNLRKRTYIKEFVFLVISIGMILYSQEKSWSAQGIILSVVAIILICSGASAFFQQILKKKGVGALAGAVCFCVLLFTLAFITSKGKQIQEDFLLNSWIEKAEVFWKDLGVWSIVVIGSFLVVGIGLGIFFGVTWEMKSWIMKALVILLCGTLGLCISYFALAMFCYISTAISLKISFEYVIKNILSLFCRRLI